MYEEEKRHRCRLCSKSFPCGRSLGGHMRSHKSSSSSTSFVEEYSKLGNGYGLRENPKKTWRLSSSVSHNEEEKQCRECGKEFQSWRALFGHMRCHSHDKIREEEEDEEGSWSGHGGGGDGEGLVRVARKKRRPRRSAAIAGPSSSAAEDHEQEDVAISLMMLSRDAGYWGSDNPAAAIESLDKNSAILEEDVNRNLDDFKKPKSYHVDDVDELYAENESDDEGSRKGSCVERKRRRSNGYGAGLGKSRYECATCKKSFHSYQALGGHRASHKRLKGRCCRGGSSFNTDTWVDPIVVDSAKASAGNNHQCGVCGKVFASGQALGGHKRCHLVTSSPTTIVIDEEEEEEEVVELMPALLDLNLPAPVEEDSSNQRRTTAAVAADAEFDSWWWWKQSDHRMRRWSG